MIKCSNCGQAIQGENLVFCPECGTRLPIPDKNASSVSPIGNIGKVWPEWKIEKQLGKGSYGTVYEAVRNDSGIESRAAIKIISIPSDPSEIESMRSEGLDDQGTRTYFKGVVDDFVSEILMMEKLKGVTNIVSIEDYKVIERTDVIGWDIYIRMELLTPFNEYIRNHNLSENDVIKLGCHICSALEICEDANVIHGGIKPENIFINDFEQFKLGDFGVSPKLTQGSCHYMAPEVVAESEWDKRSDIYSLGIVLYRLLNNNRFPFIDNEKQLISPSERNNAYERRLQGEELPAPCKASPELAEVVLRACAPDPAARFASAAEMKNALLKAAKIILPPFVGGEAEDNNGSTPSNPPQNEVPAPARKKSKMPFIIGGLVLLIILMSVGIFFLLKDIKSSVPGSSSKDDGISNSSVSVGASFSENESSSVTSNESSASTPSDESSSVSDPQVSQPDDSEQAIQKIISDAQSLASQKNYSAALAVIADGLFAYPDSEELKSKYTEYTDLLYEQEKKSIFDQVDQLAQAGDYASVVALLSDAMAKNPDDSDFADAYVVYSNAYNTQRKNDYLNSAKEKADVGDYLGAVNVLFEALTEFPEDTDIQTAYNGYYASYEASVKSKALSDSALLAQNGDYLGAVNVLKEAVSIIGEDPDLVSKITEYESADKNQVLQSGYISGSLSSVGELHTFVMAPKISGKYRFDLEISNANSDYRFYIMDSQNKILGEVYHSSDENGITVTLSEGITYKGFIEYSSGICEYTVKVGIPQSTIAISGTEIVGSLSYKDKSDHYTYVAPATGKYRFDFDISDVTADYQFRIYDSNNSLLVNDYCSSSVVTVDLTAGETYTAYVTQKDNLCDYVINISVPGST